MSTAAEIANTAAFLLYFERIVAETKEEMECPEGKE